MTFKSTLGIVAFGTVLFIIFVRDKFRKVFKRCRED